MATKRKISLVIIAAMLVSFMHQMSFGTAHAAGVGARSAFGTGAYPNELFLGGNYMELGISQWGDFGTEGNKPAGFYGTTVRNNIGMSADHDGFANGSPQAMDYYLPGTPEERFAVGYQVGANTYANSNAALKASKNMPTTVTDESVPASGLLQAKVVSTWAGTMEITQVISFKVNDKVFKNDVTIKNLSAETWDNARYMRSLDPDNTKDINGYGDYTTSNSVTHTIAEDGVALVKAEALGAVKYPIFFYSKDLAAKGSIFGFTNENPYASDAYDNAKPKGYNSKADEAITITWQSHDSIAPGGSESFTYYTSLDNRDLDEILFELDKDGRFIETSANDGTIAGIQRVVLKGGVLNDTIDPAFLKINNLPPGLSIGTVTRVSDTILDFTLTGQALDHGSEYSISNASLTIGVENLAIGTARAYTTEAFPITFIDQANAYISGGSVTETVYGTGQVGGSIVVSITDGILADLIDKTDVTVNNLPAGVDYTVDRLSDTELRLNFTGTATTPVDVFNASVTIDDAKVTGSNGHDLTTNTFSIDFNDKEPHLFIVNPILKESVRNDGTFDEPVVIKLVNGTFDNLSVADAVYGINLPAGLDIDSFVQDGPSQITVKLKGSAIDPTSAGNVHDAQFEVDKNNVAPTGTHVPGNRVASNTLSFLFNDASPSISLGAHQVNVNPDGTITEKLKVNLQNGTFDPGTAVSDIAINNLPEGVEISGVSVDPSGTELEISFNVPGPGPAVLDTASAFASVTIDPAKVTGATSPLTSEAFKFNPAKAADVTWPMIRNFNELENSVKTDLALTPDVLGGPVNWTSSNPSVIAADGTVTRPVGNDAPVTLTATYTKDGNPVTKAFDLIVKKAPTKLELVSVTVEDETPDQATLAFNQDIAGVLDEDDFKGLTIDGREVVAVSIDGDKAVVTLDEPLAPSSPLTVVYDPSAGNIVSADDADNELSPIAAANQTGITPTNNIIPLQIVTSFVEDGKLKVIFNKPIDGTDLDLTGLTFGGVPVKAPFSVNGHELVVPLPVGAADNVLAYVPGNIQDANNPNNKLGQLLPGIDLGADQFYMDPRGKLTSGLGVMNGTAAIDYQPAFDPQIPNGYKTRVPNRVSQVGLDPIPAAAPGTITKVTVNGLEVDITKDQLPLSVGTNTIKVGIYDQNHPNVLLGQYEITIVRESSGGGGGGPIPADHYVDVVIGGAKQADIVKLPIKRTTDSEGRITDQVTYTMDKAKESIEKAQATGENIARIVIPDPEDKVSEVKADIPAEVAKALADKGIDLEIFTDNALARISSASLAGVEKDFYFRFVPVKGEADKRKIEESARAATGNDNIAVVARPMTVETNLPKRQATLILPLKDVTLPADPTDRAAYLAKLGIYAEYADGTKELLTGEAVTYRDGLLGLQIKTDKFGTFTIVKENKAAAGSHKAYIIGFPDGEFKPGVNVTRGQIALMIARNLGFDEKSKVSKSTFTDVSAKHYAASAIEFVYKSGYMKGYPDGTFKADAKITRAEMMSIVAKYRKFTVDSNAAISFTDTAGHWARYIIEANRKENIIAGVENGAFRPDDYLTRAEAVVVVNRLFERGPLYGVSSPTFPDIRTSNWAFEHIEEATRDHHFTMNDDQLEQLEK